MSDDDEDWVPGPLARTRHFSVRVEDDGRLVATAVLAGREFWLTTGELALLLRYPVGDGVAPAPDDDPALLRRLAERGLLVSASSTGRFAELRRREQALEAPEWHRQAASFHAMTRWSDVRSSPALGSFPRDPAAWPPPAHFHLPASVVATTALPAPTGLGALSHALSRRRTTTRGFDVDASVTLEQLSTILHWVYGSHGLREVVPGELTLVRKTSPSGGAQHPTEAYLVARRVDGLAPGLYHYGVEHHVLELLDDLVGRDLVALNEELLAGQAHLAGASVVFYLTSRYARTFWKYPRHAKAYKVLLLDAGHLSQTSYLVCAQLGLAAFVTAAINEANVDALLGLDAFTEGAVLATGCGVALDPGAEPVYSPSSRDPGATAS
jgi:putative peptide maturation dehydrogenase